MAATRIRRGSGNASARKHLWLESDRDRSIGRRRRPGGDRRTGRAVPAALRCRLTASGWISSTPSGPATVPQEQASGILNSTAHRAEPVAHDRHGTAAESGRAQRGTNLARVMHRSLHARPAHARRNSVLPKRCQATHDATRCLPLGHVRARGPAAHGPEGVRPRAPAWNSAPFALYPDFDRRAAPR
jgi:hypothetical protein